MATEDPITEKQMGLIRGLARQTLADFEHLDDLDLHVWPIYGVRVRDMNRGQASMLIDDLRYEAGEEVEKPEYQSIFGRR